MLVNCISIALLWLLRCFSPNLASVEGLGAAGSCRGVAGSGSGGAAAVATDSPATHCHGNTRTLLQLVT